MLRTRNQENGGEICLGGYERGGFNGGGGLFLLFCWGVSKMFLLGGHQITSGITDYLFGHSSGKSHTTSLMRAWRKSAEGVATERQSRHGVNRDMASQRQLRKIAGALSLSSAKGSEYCSLGGEVRIPWSV